MRMPSFALGLIFRCGLPLIAVLGLSACGSQFNIAGNSALPYLDGEQLYLRVVSVDKEGRHSTTLDSSRVVHGRFSFAGSADNVVMAELHTRNERLMPIVVEGGNSQIEMDRNGQSIKGGPLSEKLNKFLLHLNYLEGEFWNVDRRRQRLIYQGMSAREAYRLTEAVRSNLNQQIEELEVNFVLDNADNALGSGYFEQMVSQLNTPTLTQQLQRILDAAPASFFRSPEVQNFVQATGYQSPPEKLLSSSKKRNNKVDVIAH